MDLCQGIEGKYLTQTGSSGEADSEVRACSYSVTVLIGWSQEHDKGAARFAFSVHPDVRGKCRPGCSYFIARRRAAACSARNLTTHAVRVLVSDGYATDKSLVDVLTKILPLCQHYCYVDHFVKVLAFFFASSSTFPFACYRLAQSGSLVAGVQVHSRFEYGLVNHALASAVRALLKVRKHAISPSCIEPCLSFCFASRRSTSFLWRNWRRSIASATSLCSNAGSTCSPSCKPWSERIDPHPDQSLGIG